MNTNKKNGNAFEKALCSSLSAFGFWAHNMAQNAQGQPFDVLAARNGKSYPIDCKVCEHDRFALSRIEDNQRGAMSLWEETGNGNGWFALLLTDGAVIMIPWYQLRDCDKSSLNAEEIIAKGMPLSAWVNQCS